MHLSLISILQCNIISKKSIRRNKILIANRNSRVKFKLKILRENDFFYLVFDVLKKCN